MANVSNDALWEKLSEIGKKVEEVSVMQKGLLPKQESAGIKPDFTGIKDEITSGVSNSIRVLGLSSDSHFEANRKNVQLLYEKIIKVLNIVSRIRKQQREDAGLQEAGNPYFNLKLFKIRKTSFAATILGLFVFALTLFCMKQQNDYVLLMDEYHKQGIIVQKLERELKAVEEKQQKKQPKPK